MNAYDQMRQAVQEAKVTMNAADSVANTMGQMLVGRLQRVDESTLRRLKRELRDFNIHTGRWRK